MAYRPTHVMMRSCDLNPNRGFHDETMERIELDKPLPVIAAEISRGGKLSVRVPANGPLSGWWLGFDPGSHQGDIYGYAIDMSLPHLMED